MQTQFDLKWPKIAIIILNWNGWQDTIECLESLYQINYPNYYIIVVDNGSSDESLQKIDNYSQGMIKIDSPLFQYSSFNKPINVIKLSGDDAGRNILVDNFHVFSNKRLFLIISEQNLGFSSGNNLGIKFAATNIDPKYVLLLNNDTVVSSNFLKELVAVAESDPSIGVIGPKVLYYDYENRTDVIWFAGGKIDLSKYPGYFHRDYSLIDTHNNITSRIECDWVSGAALLFKAIRGCDISLNEKFFFGCEDVDLCINFKRRGYKIVVDCNSIIWHKIGVARKKRANKKITNVKDVLRNLNFIRMNTSKFYIYLPIYLYNILRPIENTKRVIKHIYNYAKDFLED